MRKKLLLFVWASAVPHRAKSCFACAFLFVTRKSYAISFLFKRFFSPFPFSPFFPPSLPFPPLFLLLPISLHHILSFLPLPFVNLVISSLKLHHSNHAIHTTVCNVLISTTVTLLSFIGCPKLDKCFYFGSLHECTSIKPAWRGRRMMAVKGPGRLKETFMAGNASLNVISCEGVEIVITRISSFGRFFLNFRETGNPNLPFWPTSSHWQQCDLFCHLGCCWSYFL